ncbi:MAG: ATP-dependent helicase [Candidatus Aceula meridiana]|nr:ATP-dependent helicase [Candidatus Aceula meridiana]
MQKPSDLNEKQWQAVKSQARHLLIIAGPGTGKTHTLTRRIARIAHEQKGTAYVLAITFTNKAAQEMRERLTKYISESVEDVEVATFHKFCLGILRRYSSLKDYRIATSVQVKEVSKSLWPHLPERERKQKLEDIGRTKSCALKETHSEVTSYNEELRKQKLIDFDDILLETVFLLEADKTLLEKMQETYSDIFVDEYQDINEAQHKLLLLLAAKQTGVTAIGDPQQSIYGFRGSNVKFFEGFAADFPGSEKIELSENYRSASHLLKASGQISKKGRILGVPALEAKFSGHGDLIVHCVPSEKAESEYVVHQIEKLVGGTSMFSQDSKRVAVDDHGDFTFGDIAVLYRTNAQQKVLQEAFERSGIPHQASGDKLFYEEKEVADFLEDIRKDTRKPVTLIVSDLKARHQETGRDCFLKMVELVQKAKSRQEFFDNLFLERENDTLDQNVEKVSLMTLHCAKGLEFPVVFIIGCEEGLIPFKGKGDCIDVEEERRLFYVGMTRAKQRLYLLNTQKRMAFGRVYVPKPSRFLSDIEETLKRYEEGADLPRKKKEDTQLNLFGKI